MTSRDAEIALVRIAEALEELHLTLEKIEANTAPPELIDKGVEQFSAIHAFYYARLMDIEDPNLNAFGKAKKLRSLIDEAMNSIEVKNKK